MADDLLENGAAEMGRGIERLLPDEPNFRRVRYTGGSENRVGETTGQTRHTKDFKAVENPTRLQETRRSGTPDEASDLTLHVVGDLIERGDRIERIADDTPYRVETVTPYRIGDEIAGYQVEANEQND